MAQGEANGLSRSIGRGFLVAGLDGAVPATSWVERRPPPRPPTWLRGAGSAALLELSGAGSRVAALVLGVGLGVTGGGGAAACGGCGLPPALGAWGGKLPEPSPRQPSSAASSNAAAPTHSQ